PWHSSRRRKADGEARAVAERSLEGQRAAMGDDDRPRDRQAEPRTAALAASGGVETDERLEDARGLSRGDTRPGIPDTQETAVVLAVDGELDEAPGGRVLHRVLDQVQHRPLQRRHIAEHRHRLPDL